VLNHAFQAMLRAPLVADTYLAGLGAPARGAVSDVLHVLAKSAPTFKHMASPSPSPSSDSSVGKSKPFFSTAHPEPARLNFFFLFFSLF
jgi:hypothetical protein